MQTVGNYCEEITESRQHRLPSWAARTIVLMHVYGILAPELRVPALEISRSIRSANWAADD